MRVRIDFLNGDWDVMTLESPTSMLGLETAIRLKAQCIRGTILGRQAIIPIAAIRCIQEWPDGL